MKPIAPIILSSVLIFVICTPCVPTAYAASAVETAQSRLQKIVNDTTRDGTQISVMVQAADSAVPFFAHQSERHIIAASISKLFAAYGLLAILGSSRTISTAAYFQKDKFKNGKLETPLIIKGFGDPFLVSERLWLFAQNIAAQGIREIPAGIVVDQTFFSEYPDFSMKQANERRASVDPYLAPIAPTSLNFNTVTLAVMPPLSNGQSLSAVALPPTSWIRVTPHKLSTGTRQPNLSSQRSTSSDGRLNYTISGRARADRPTYQYESILQPSIYIGRVLADMLRGLGVNVGPAVTEHRGDKSLVADTSKFAAIPFESHPMSRLVQLLTLYSNNFMTDMLMFQLDPAVRDEDAPAGGARASYGAGMSALLAWFKERGVVISGERFKIASGLTRGNRLNAREVVAMLKMAWADPLHQFEVFGALPVAGHNGTLRRYRHWPVVRAKTGSLANLFNLAGVMYSASGKPYLFAMFAHNPKKQSYQMREKIDALVMAVHEVLDD